MRTAVLIWGVVPEKSGDESRSVMDLDQQQVQRLLDLCEVEVSSGRLPACQVALALDGEIAVRRTFGAPDDARFTVFSVTKALTAAAVWLFLDGALKPETRVAELVPEFAREGLDAVTVEHLMGKMDVGILCCPDLVPDVWEIVEALPAAVQRLLDRAP